MKKHALIFTILVLLLSACQSAAVSTSTPLVVTQAIATPTETPAATTTLPVPTATLQSTPTTPESTPTPQSTFTPTATAFVAVTGKIQAHRLALDVSNAGTEMKRVNIYGTGVLQDIQFSPNGKYLAAATGRGIYVYSAETFEQVSFIDVNDLVSAIAFSPDGLVLAAAINGKVSLWNALSGQKLMSLDGEFVGIWTLAYGSGGYIAASGSNCRGCGTPQDVMVLWNAKTGHQIYSEHDIGYVTESLAFTSDGKRLAFGGKEGLTIIESATGKKLYVAKSINQLIRDPIQFIFSDDDKRLFVTDSEPEKGWILDIATQETEWFVLCTSGFIRANKIGGCFSKDKITLFDLSDGQMTSEINAPGVSDWGILAAISPDAKKLVYQIDETVHIVDVQTGNEVKTLAFNAFEHVEIGTVFLDGKQRYAAAILNERGQVDLIDLETGAHLQTYSLPDEEILGFAFRPDGKTAAILKRNILTLWDIQSQRVIYETNFLEHVQGPFAFSPDGLHLFFTDPEENILELDLLAEALLHDGKNTFMYSFADLFVHNNYHFNSAGNLVLFDTKGKFPEFNDVKTGQKITIPFELITADRYTEIEAFAFNEGDKFLAIGSTTDIYVWNLETLKQVATLSGHESRGGDGWSGEIRSVLFSPQSDLLVSVGWDETTRFWNIRTGQEIRRLNVCCGATFTPDGRFLVTVGDGVLRVWGVPTSP